MKRLFTLCVPLPRPIAVIGLRSCSLTSGLGSEGSDWAPSAQACLGARRPRGRRTFSYRSARFGAALPSTAIPALGDAYIYTVAGSGDCAPLVCHGPDHR